MATPTVIQGDLYVQGNLSSKTQTYPTASVTNAGIAAAAAISASKIVRHQSIDRELYGPAVTVAALTTDVHIARGAGTLVQFSICCNGTIATGADRTVTVDLQKSTGAGAFATVLSGTAGLTNSSALRTTYSGTISSASFIADDKFRIIVTVAGSASNQALGLFATLHYEEAYV